MIQRTDREYFDSLEFENKYHCSLPMGCFCSQGGTLFRLWAPTAEQVELYLYETGDRPEEPVRFAMERAEKGTWVRRFKRNLHGTYYTYDVTVDGVKRTTADPYAKACGLNGNRSMVVDLTETDPEGWAEDVAPAAQPENIIYEIHVKDFSWDPSCDVNARYRGKFLGLCQTGTTLAGDGLHPTGLDYLKTLGVTHLELMPVYDYGSVDEAGNADQFNWGYDPVNYNVPEGSYATDPYHGEVRIRELKQTIQTLHAHGFRVIMDVVYNHTYSLDSWLFRTVPWYYYRQRPDGTSSNGSGCGNDTASERSMCAKYILDSVLYWAEEYHFDGFRFDLMGLMPADLMNEIRHALDNRFGAGEKLVFGEPWRAEESFTRPGTLLADKEQFSVLSHGVAAFCDATRDAVKGNLMQADARGFVNGGSLNGHTLASCIRGWTGGPGDFCVKAPSQTMGYLSSHDDWTLWDRLVNSLDSHKHYAGYNPVVLKANRLAAAMLFCCQGSLFMLSGEEFARTKYGIKNTYASSLHVNQLDWHRAWENRALADYYRGLIALRKQLPGLTDKSPRGGQRVRKVMDLGENCASVLLDNAAPGSAWPQILMIFNTSKEVKTMELPEGPWQVLCDGESSFRWQEASHVTETVTLEPGTALILGL